MKMRKFRGRTYMEGAVYRVKKLVIKSKNKDEEE